MNDYDLNYRYEQMSFDYEYLPHRGVCIKVEFEIYPESDEQYANAVAFVNKIEAAPQIQLISSSASVSHGGKNLW